MDASVRTPRLFTKIKKRYIKETETENKQDERKSSANPAVESLQMLEQGLVFENRKGDDDRK